MNGRSAKANPMVRISANNILAPTYVGYKKRIAGIYSPNRKTNKAATKFVAALFI